MREAKQNILQCIGNTSLLPIRNIVPLNGARVLLKVESENPTGSMKDRMVLAMIEAGEADGRLKPGGPVVEYTGGSTGVSLAFVCTVKRHPLHIVSSDALAREKLDHMRLLGATLQILPSEGRGTTEKLTRDMIEAAGIVAASTAAFWTDQMKNKDQMAAYSKMAGEIWEQTGGEIDGFVQSVGTAASIRGIAESLRPRSTKLRVVAVEPSESPVLSGGRPGAHKMDGIGAGFVVRYGTRISLTTSSKYRRKSDGYGLSPGARGGTVCRYVDRGQCHRGVAVGGTIGTACHRDHHSVRYGYEVSKNLRSGAEQA